MVLNIPSFHLIKKNKKLNIIRKQYVFFLLFLIFAFAFIYSPYWHVPVTHFFLKYFVLSALFLVGLWWADSGSGNVKLPKIKIKIPYLVILFLLLYLVNYKFLIADIAYRGDEDYHINLLLNLPGYLNFFWQQRDIYLIHNQLFWILLFLVLASLSYLFLRGFIRGRVKKTLNLLAIGALLLSVPLSAAILFPENIFREHMGTDVYRLFEGSLRYPFFQKWINLVFILPDFYSNIMLYRIVPFLSTLAIAIFLFYKFNQQLQSKLLSFLFSLAFTTVPLILFYSNILYLEMPIMLLMVICLFNLKSLVKTEAKELISNPIWYCLLLMGFLKETALIFLLLIIMLRVGYQFILLHKIKGMLRPILSEIKLAILVLLPVIIFLSLRSGPAYTFYLKNVISSSNYFVLGKALVEQTGVLIAVAVIGLLYCFRKKDKFILIALIVLLMGLILFFLGYIRRVDLLANNASIFIGYSRFNLIIMPMIIYASYFFIVSIKKRYQIFLLLLIFISNIVFLPFKIDGARLPNWGSPNTDAAEYTYPYDEAIHWLSRYNQKQNLILLGQYYPYFGLQHYFDNYKFHPKIFSYPFGSERPDEKLEHQMLELFFEKPQFPADTILYHSVNNINLNTNTLYGGRYKVVRRVRNSLHSLYIFSKID